MATASATNFAAYPHDIAQGDWIAESARVYALWTGSPPGQVRPRPYEGWVAPWATHWCYDAMGTQRAYHDVKPHDVLAPTPPNSPVAANLVAGLVAHGLPTTLDGLLQQPMCHRFTVAPSPQQAPMAVTVVNIVHTSYCSGSSSSSSSSGGSGGSGGSDEEDGGASGAIVSHAFFWRRLQHLGYQQSFVHTSLKICYIPPLNASHILFQSGRILETGANNADVATVMLDAVTLPYLRAAGLRALQCVRRERLNIVATSVLPEGRRLRLTDLSWRNPGLVTYNAANFAGAIIKVTAVPANKATMLAFGAGPIVCVGTNDFDQLRAAYAAIYPLVMRDSYIPSSTKRAGADVERPAAETKRARRHRF